MKPDVTFDGERISIDFRDVLNSMPAEQRMELVRYAAMDEQVIQDAVEQLATGMTGDGSYLGTKFLNDMREKLMPLMQDVARECVRRLVQERDNALREKRRHEAWAWKLFHAWPAENRLNLPALPDFGYSWPPSTEDAQKLIDEFGGAK